MTAGVACKSTVHFSTSFSTTRSLFRTNGELSLRQGRACCMAQSAAMVAHCRRGTVMAQSSGTMQSEKSKIKENRKWHKKLLM